MGNFRFAKYNPDSSAVDDPNKTQDLSSSEIATLKQLVIGGASLAAPLIIGSTNQQVQRASGNAGVDNVALVLFSFILPAGSMGPNGRLIWEAETSCTNSANSKLFGLRIGGVSITPEYSITTVTNDNRGLYWSNTALAAQKYRGSFLKQTGNTTGFTTTAINTAVDQTVEFYGRWASASVAGEVLALESFRALVEFGA